MSYTPFSQNFPIINGFTDLQYMDIIWYGIFIAALVWVAFYAGLHHGGSVGYQEGWQDGFKKGKEDGEKQGLKKGVTERVLNSIAGSKGGVLDDTEKQVREEIYAKLMAKPAAPPKPPPSLLESWLVSLRKVFWWAAMTGLVAGVVYFSCSLNKGKKPVNADADAMPQAMSLVPSSTDPPPTART